jgi:hypothetical protein
MMDNKERAKEGNLMDLLQRAWQSWKRIAQFIGDLVARVVLTAFYFTLFLPFGLGVRLWGDPLAIGPDHRPEWLKRALYNASIDDARRLS